MMMDVHLDIENEEKRHVLAELPQSYDQSLVSGRERKTYSVEQIQKEVLNELKNVMGCEEERLQILPLLDIGSFKGKVGFRVIDEDAVLQGHNDKIEIVSVLVVKSKRQQDVLVPIVMPHKHPLHYGAILKSKLDHQYEDTYGNVPSELIKSRTRAWLEKMYDWICESKSRIILACVAAVALLGVSGMGITSSVQTFQENRQIAERQLNTETMALENAGMWLDRAQKAPTLSEKLQSIDELFSDGSLGLSKVTETLIQRMGSADQKTADAALEVSRDILRIDFQRVDAKPYLATLRGSRNGRALMEALESQSVKVKDPKLSQKFKQIVSELQKLRDAPISQ